MVAVEADGPHHFSLSKPHVPLGGTVAKWRCLEMRGWRVLSVPYFQVKYTQGLRFSFSLRTAEELPGLEGFAPLSKILGKPNSLFSAVRFPKRASNNYVAWQGPCA